MTSSTTPHWKASQTAKGSLELSLWTKRWLGVLAVLVAAGLLVWALWPEPRIRPFVFAVSVPDITTESRLPPLAYVSGDLEALDGLKAHRFASIEQPEAGQTTADNLRAYVKRHLQDRSWRDKDVVILYMITHGVTLPGGTAAGSLGSAPDSPQEAAPAEITPRAVLAGSRFQFASSTGEEPSEALRLSEDVLDPAHACPAGTKLLVLETCRVPTLPGEGMFVNELANCVHQVLQGETGQGEAYSSDLWVLVPNGPFEVATMNDEARRSAFSQAFEEAIRGEADGRLGDKKDAEITVGELYAYVRDRVREQSPGQTVLLLRGGQGVVEDDADLANTPILVSAHDPVPSPDSEADEEAADPGETEKKQTQPQKVAQSPQPPAESAGGPESPSPETQAADGGAPPAAAAAPTTTATADAGQSPPAADAASGTAAQPPAGAAAQSQQAAEAAGQAADVASDPTAASTANGATADSGAPKAPPAAGGTAQQPRGRRPVFTDKDDVWARAWRLHEYLMSRETSDSWSPVDFAPVLWRDLEATLVELDLLLQLEPEANEKTRTELLARVEGLVDRLEQLAIAMDEGRVPSPAAARRDSLIQAWARLLESDAARSWKTAHTFVERHAAAAPSDTQSVAQRMEALRRAADLTYAAGEYVALLDAATACGVSVSRIEAFADSLNAYLELLRTVTQDLNSSAHAVPRPDHLRRLDQLASDLEAHRDAAAQLIRWEHPRQSTGALAAAALVAIRKAGDSVNVPRRDRWSFDEAGSRPIVAIVNGDDRRLQRIGEVRADVYRRYLDLAIFEEQGRSAFPERSSGSAGASLLQWTRRVGGHLGESFNMLVEGVLSNRRPTGDGQVPEQSVPAFLLAHRARLLDIGTIRKRDLQDTQQYLDPPAIELPDRLFLAAEEQSAKLRFDTPHEIALRANAYGPSSVDAKIQISFDSRLLEVHSDGQALSDKDTLPLQAGESIIPVLVTARRPATGRNTPSEERERAAVLTIAVVEGTRNHEPITIRCDLPLERPLRLAVDQWTPPQERNLEPPSGDWSDPIRLRPYPNRQTTFPLALENLSREARTVDVELYPALQDLKRFRQHRDENGLDADINQHLSELLGSTPEPIGKVAGLVIEAGQAPKAVVFAKEADPAANQPQDPAAAAGAAAGAGGGASTGGQASGSEPTPQAIAVSNGMICRVKQTSPTEDEWLYFIEVDPLVPTEFLRTPTAQFIRVGGKLAIQLTIAADHVIPGIGEKPLLVRFSEPTEREFRRQQRGRGPEDQLTPAKPANLWFEVEERESPWRVLIDVGSQVGEEENVFYERALDLRITRASATQLTVDELRQVRTEVQIAALSMTRQGADGQPQEVTFQAPDSLQDAAFNVRQAIAEPRPTIMIHFHVDAKDTAFDKYSDRVTLHAGSDRSFVRHSDRQIAVTAVDSEQPGLTLLTRVEDFKYQWQPAEKDAVVPVTIALSVEDNGIPNVQTQETSVKLDASPPEITDLLVNTSGAEDGASPRIEVRAEDNLTGIAVLELGRDKNGDRVLGEDEKLELPLLASPTDASAGGTWRFEFPKDLAKPRERVVLLARAVDGVGIARTNSTEFIMPLIREKVAPQPKKGMIWGVATFNGTPRPGITVKLQGPAQAPDSITDDRGRFMFRDLPAGNYLVVAEGTVDLTLEKGAKLAGQTTVRGFDPNRNPRSEPQYIRLEKK